MPAAGSVCAKRLNRDAFVESQTPQRLDRCAVCYYHKDMWESPKCEMIPTEKASYIPVEPESQIVHISTCTTSPRFGHNLLISCILFNFIDYLHCWFSLKHSNHKKKFTRCSFASFVAKSKSPIVRSCCSQRRELRQPPVFLNLSPTRISYYSIALNDLPLKLMERCICRNVVIHRRETAGILLALAKLATELLGLALRKG